MPAMTIDLEKFKLMFPQWANCTDGSLSLWVDISECMVCIPKGCTAMMERVPYLMLAHVLKVNGFKCETTAVVDPSADPCECDDSMLTQLLNNGQRISSVNFEGISVSFDNAGFNDGIAKIGSGPFSAWLSATPEGRMIAILMRRAAAGVHMAIVGRGGFSAYGDDNPMLGHLRGPN